MPFGVWWAKRVWAFPAGAARADVIAAHLGAWQADGIVLFSAGTLSVKTLGGLPEDYGGTVLPAGSFREVPITQVVHCSAPFLLLRFKQ